MGRKKKISILGSTGVLGRRALQLATSDPESFEIEALIAKSNFKLLAKQAIASDAKVVAISEENCYKPLKELLYGHGIQVLAGVEGCEAAAASAVDLVVATISGISGLKPTLASLKNNVNLAIANKEVLICSRELIRSLTEVNLIPIDSEHHAISQIYDPSVTRITLTASGGPFFPNQPPAQVTPAQALKHPIWKMGPKNSVDSATLMNKILEIFEAEVLFGISKTKMNILIHPQSVIHGMVSYQDGNNIAVLYNPDMGIPIANALSWPQRKPYDSVLNLASIGELTFFNPNKNTYSALELIDSDQHIVINAANEIAVDLFLKGVIPFSAIVPIVLETLNHYSCNPTINPDEILEYDKDARAVTMNLVSEMNFA